jgi:hypothetical protein
VNLCDVIFYSNVRFPEATNWSFCGNSTWFLDFSFYDIKYFPNYPWLLCSYNCKPIFFMLQICFSFM